ncbi:MAG TPA: hypothetical protein PLH57_12360 [Oligoflexia bacterium]|nr:hypothetical protein [Oligoflexia bacterium]
MNFDHTARLFHTALVATKATKAANYSEQLTELVRTPAFVSILKSVQNLAHELGITEEQAAERIIVAFRAIDSVWSEYLCKEGIESLKSHLSQ